MIFSKEKRKHKRLVIGFVVLSFVFSLFFVEGIGAKGSIGTCKAAIFSDRTKVKRLYGRRVHNKVLPASTTKVMTALLAIERLPLNQYVTVRKSATYAQPSKIYVKPGEKYRVKDLLYAILLKSANDASIVLAEAISGSEKKFVQLMNRKAKQIDAYHTRFANSNGLPTKSSQYTTAYDMYLIFREALKYQFFRKAIKLKYKTIYSKAGRKISLKSHNKILFKNWKRNIYGKTGYTRAAGACFVGTLEKGSSTLILAVFGCTNRWEYIKYIVSKYGGIPL